MKRRNNRFLAGTLAGLMMLTMLPVTALAAENDTADGTTTLTAWHASPSSAAEPNTRQPSLSAISFALAGSASQTPTSSVLSSSEYMRAWCCPR